ncbi:transcriptional regulator, MerR family [Hyphomonas neptunium ATCC 15444]|uniref:Transcriptional regulator, MerR family n=2 Tax=Hyphomonas TaxID=85 RepID=Q0C1G1_HYPNA|nr:transcriptional regulator, MerR family [Hyphomonas neptunium ATCC 15444]KCZ92486.1 MerR family transcriptional regulator [Hyphomonas hirschiana VP5]
MLHLPIGEVARRTKLKIPTIRFYEEIGLLPAPQRAPNGRRVYGETEISRLAFIQNARQLGFGLDQIRALLDLSSRPASTCEDARTIAQDNLQIVNPLGRALIIGRKGHAHMAIVQNSIVGTIRLLDLVQRLGNQERPDPIPRHERERRLEEIDPPQGRELVQHQEQLPPRGIGLLLGQPARNLVENKPHQGFGARDTASVSIWMRSITAINGSSMMRH